MIPLEWREIEGYPGYYVSNRGDVLNCWKKNGPLQSYRVPFEEGVLMHQSDDVWQGRIYR